MRRKDDKIKHHDFLQLMVDAKNKTLTDENEDNLADPEAHHTGTGKIQSIDSNESSFEITEDDILANSYLFFIAGHETTAALLSFILYALAVNPECQEKLYQEIISYEGNIDYDTIARMQYLDACVSETLRLYSPSLETSRRASRDYQLGIYDLSACHVVLK